VLILETDFVRGFSSPFQRGGKTNGAIFRFGPVSTSTSSSGHICLAAFPPSKENDSKTILLGKNKQQGVQYNSSPTGLSSSSSSSSSWDAFKDGVYDFVDFIRGGTDAVFLSSSLSLSNLEKSKSTMAVTYHETMEKASETEVPKSTVLPVIKFQEMIPSPNILSKQDTSVMEQYRSSLKSSSKDTSTLDSNLDGDNRYPSKFRQTFDSAKDIFYGMIDSLTVTSSKKGKKGKNDDDDGDDDPFSSVADTLEESKVACKTSVNKDKAVVAVSKYAPDLSSLNPAKRIQANLAISTAQQQQQETLENQSESVTASVKKVVFGVVDFFQTAQNTLMNLPTEVEKKVEMTQNKIGRTVEEIQNTPKKIQQQVEDTKKSLQETQEKAIQFVNDVQQVPKTVGDTVVGTMREVQALPTKVQSSIQETQKSIEVAKEEVQSLVMETKYLTGLEKRPTPPPPPPRPKTSSEKAKELAMKVTKGTAVFAGKAAVVVVKGTVGMVASGVKLAWQATTTRRKKKGIGGDEFKSSGMSKDTPTQVPQSDITPKSIAEIDPMLDKEVSEALRLAEEAVSKKEREESTMRISLGSHSDSIISSDSSDDMKQPMPVVTSQTDMDINEVVERAQAAAEQAKRNAEELQEMLNKRSIAKK